jgi:hypothetical protein
VVGGALGYGWFALFPQQDDMLSGIAQVAAGALAGIVAGGSWGWFFNSWQRATSGWQLAAVCGWITCGALMVVGVSHIGGWTNADGPSTASIIGILGIPGSLLGVSFISHRL